MSANQQRHQCLATESIRSMLAGAALNESYHLTQLRLENSSESSSLASKHDVSEFEARASITMSILRSRTRQSAPTSLQPGKVTDSITWTLDRDHNLQTLLILTSIMFLGCKRTQQHSQQLMAASICHHNIHQHLEDRLLKAKRSHIPTLEACNLEERNQ